MQWDRNISADYEITTQSLTEAAGCCVASPTFCCSQNDSPGFLNAVCSERNFNGVQSRKGRVHTNELNSLGLFAAVLYRGANAKRRVSNQQQFILKLIWMNAFVKNVAAGCCFQKEGIHLECERSSLSSRSSLCCWPHLNLLRGNGCSSFEDNRHANWKWKWEITGICDADLLTQLIITRGQFVWKLSRIIWNRRQGIAVNKPRGWRQFSFTAAVIRAASSLHVGSLTKLQLKLCLTLLLLNRWRH